MFNFLLVLHSAQQQGVSSNGTQMTAARPFNILCDDLKWDDAVCQHLSIIHTRAVFGHSSKGNYHHHFNQNGLETS
jgi:hypothetical protein